jgi:exopolyphosphatase/guanosine-5'-triphosphate,3'-diphosphate pyrophosphatase
VRLGLLDVGSNTIHLLVVDARRGARPEPVRSHKTELRLAELLRDDGSLAEGGTRALVASVSAARRAAEEEDVDELLAFATSAVREARDGAAVLAAVRAEFGVDLQELSGTDEARLTFLAVRRWFGWSAGRLLCLDIGGGSLELAAGPDEEPEVAFSLPLGAGRVTRERLAGDPPPQRRVADASRWAQDEVSTIAPRLLADARPDRVVATSKTFRSLARLTGAAPYRSGQLVPRHLRRCDLDPLVDRLARMSAQERTQLPGVSPGRAPQLLAGAIVARATLEALDVEAVEICPWALREGIMLRRLDWLAHEDERSQDRGPEPARPGSG